MIITKTYNVKLMNYSAENMSKDHIILTLESRLKQINRNLEDAAKDKAEIEEALEKIREIPE